MELAQVKGEGDQDDTQCEDSEAMCREGLKPQEPQPQTQDMQAAAWHNTRNRLAGLTVFTVQLNDGLTRKEEQQKKPNLQLTHFGGKEG